MPMWFEETYRSQLRFGLRVTAYHYRGRSEYQTIDIFETETFGRTLALDNVFQTSVGDEYQYHEMLVHPALSTAPSIERVLVIGGGDGGTVREVLRYPEVKHVTMVELDRQVVEACKQHLREFQVPWDDPRLELVFQDGVTYLQACQDRFDVVLVDGPDPVGPAEGLYQSPFYSSCRECLRADGVFAAQVEAPQLMHEDFTRIVKTLRGVFPRVDPYFGPVPIYVCGSWGFAYATNSGADPLAVRPERAELVEPVCRQWSRDIHRAAFVQSPLIRRRLVD
ncbi:MAG: polyamine aminopropyltransferase [Myxococcales bacterium]|nr:polyamine aminopropyltransferase [Myxococcales bacterium]